MRPLKTFEDWKFCITEICKVPLTPDFVERRLKELCDPDAFETQKFVQSWGEKHLRQVIAWFEQAQDDIRKTTP
ncbi:hypothetical protein [Brucella intermedia]|uniref:hypothetical protein n=1 Tax=Brucella intermedia TaxID=94625 RepID=UPI0022488CF2|nr:hypothetical protein [Brucella intermedia]